MSKVKRAAARSRPWCAAMLPLLGLADPVMAQAADDDETRLGDIVVTAQKRAENLQTVPISIVAVGADRLDRQPFASSADLARHIPGLLIGKNFMVGQTYFRGVGQSLGLPGAESPIATYLDGIYLAAPAVAVFDLVNVDQVAFLKGPQGTLFGRNATGGVIQVTTRRPDDRFAAKAELGYGRFATWTGKAHMTGPVAQDLAASLSFAGRDRRHGYVRNVTTGHDLLDEKSWTIQNRWAWTPGDSSADLILIHGRHRNVSGSVAGIYPGALGPDRTTTYLGYRTIASRVDGGSDNRSTIASLKLGHDLGWARVSNQLSFTDYHGDTTVNQTGTPGRPNPNNVPAQIADVRADIRTWTNEFQIQSPEGASLQWIAGVFALHSTTRLNATVSFDAVPGTRYRTRLRTRSWAGFAQATAPLTPDTRLTLGLRYTGDDKRLDGITIPATPLTAQTTLSRHWSRLTWRAAIDHDFAPGVMGFLSWDRGFRSGTYTNNALNVPPSNPETIDAYSAGLKTEWLDRRLRLNATGFFYDYRNIQLRSLRGADVIIYNAARSRIYGGEVELDAVLARGLRLFSGVQLLHARYRDFPNGVANVPTPLPVVPAGCTGAPVLRPGGTARLICDLSGNQMVKAPKYAGNAGLAFERSFAWGQLSLLVQDSYSGRYYFEPDNRLRQPGYHWIDASARWTSPDRRLSLTLWGSNLAGEHVYDSATTGALAYIYGPGLPITYGMTAGLSF